MTSAEFSCGLAGERNSSRVLQPPGGISNIFGGCDDNQASGAASAAKPQQPKNTKDNIFGTTTEENKTASVNNNKSSNVFGADAEGDQENQKTKKAVGDGLSCSTPPSSPQKHSSPLKNPITGANMPHSPSFSRRNLSPQTKSPVIGNHLNERVASPRPLRRPGSASTSPTKNPITGQYSPGSPQHKRIKSAVFDSNDRFELKSTVSTPSCSSPSKNPITGENVPASPEYHRKNLGGRSSINPITGEAINPQPQQKAIHTSTKVRQPPGGASSGLW